MSPIPDPAGTPNPQVASPQPSNAQPDTPNQYHLHGGGISVSYFPDGFGPVTTGGGRFTYQDAHRALNFTGQEIRTADVPDLGTVVSVTLVRTVDTGATTFSVLLPRVTLPGQTGAAVHIHTDGITTVHRAFVGMIGHTQAEIYTVTSLSGTARRGILPL
jgi:hypothetical protein